MADRMTVLGIKGYGPQRRIINKMISSGPHAPAERTIAIYHFMDCDADVRETTEALHSLLWQAINVEPAALRHLYLDIHKEHQDTKGVWDQDAFKVQYDIVCRVLFPCLTTATLPLCTVTNGNGQYNNLPKLPTKH